MGVKGQQESLEKFKLFSERLRGRMARLGIQQNELAEQMGKAPSAISHWVLGNNRATPKSMRKLAVILSCDPLWLAGEDDNEPAPTVVNEPGAAREVFKPQLRRIPIISWACAGAATDYSDLTTQIDDHVESECADPNAFALILEGDSMEPRFEAGDIVIFSPSTEPRNGNYVVARLREGDGVLFKRYRRMGKEGMTVVLESLNPNYGPREFEAHAFRFIFPAVEFRGRLRM